MPCKLVVHMNEDDCFLAWSTSSPIPGCRGFAIQRELSRDGKTELTWLMNRVGFENQSHTDGEQRPSTEWPFQRFTWTDHGTDTSDTVRYRVVPVVRSDAGALELRENLASPWSETRTLGTNGDSPFQAFFNRGFVMSQFMGRYLQKTGKSLKEFKETISDADDKTIRDFLSGDLRLQMLELVSKAKDAGDHVYAALFELGDTELVDALKALGARAHVVLANGSVQKKKNETAANARKRDENVDARKQLKASHVDVELHDRFLSPGALGHNKFLVVTDAKGKPKTAWTGSTNWTSTGLCTQLNNGLLIRDPQIAQIYLDQWHRLRDAGSEFPADLVDENSKAKQVGPDAPGHIRSAVWFTRARKSVDLEAIKSEVQKAREAILFLMFMPGGSGPLAEIMQRSGEPNLYVRGVVSTLPADSGDESEVDVTLVSTGHASSHHFDIIEPGGIAHPFAFWAEEVTRKQFLAGVGHAIIHSKVIVIDPFSPDPTVITGSHNFSSSASDKNDENFIVVHGDRALAESYAVNAIAAWQHYRWRAYLTNADKPFDGLKDDDAWMAPMLAANRRELQFWGV
jgi:phosphatidylserine/phosphatidylglycerophosphate/cardiolipin synthase-like enzyme